MQKAEPNPRIAAVDALGDVEDALRGASEVCAALAESDRLDACAVALVSRIAAGCADAVGDACRTLLP
ncbi:hypothetical protein [Raoultibacter timonensis]|uniref:hypothetical protein n=1 Tax=Raoultibacter timonensis TaxID=1907662 RepID=UPI0026DB48C9|nr:hypothetical protein [Raoultibacter timonensis]